MDKLLLKVDKMLNEAHENGIKLSFEFNRNDEIVGSYQDVINKRLEFARLQEVVRELEKEYKELLKQKTFGDVDKYLDQAVDGNIIIKTDNIDKDALKPLADRLLEKLGKGFVFIANVQSNKVTFIAKSNVDIHAGKIAKEAAIITGGNGGGRPDMAQAGGKDITKVDEALLKVKELVKWENLD